MMWYTVSKTTLIFSNLPGPRIPLQFNGIKSKGLIALVPGLGDLAFGITAVSMGDTLYISVLPTFVWQNIRVKNHIFRVNLGN